MYHGHQGVQRGDGLTGPIIIKVCYDINSPIHSPMNAIPDLLWVNFHVLPISELSTIQFSFRKKPLDVGNALYILCEPPIGL